MKKFKFYLLVFICAMITFEIWNISYSPKYNKNADNIEIENISPTKFNKILNDTANINNILFTPWDIGSASSRTEKRTHKPYTIMIYMNGSDLESKHGAATADILQIMESGLNSANANIIIFTGGTNRWKNNIIPSNNCLIWEVADGKLIRITDVGLVNMGDSGTLSSFIKYTLSNFPANKFGLIMWDHGGGSIAGYGNDEKFNNSNLSLLDMEYAFDRANLGTNKLEFLGFDSCLMASVEMAVISSNYFNYLIASEDLEPGAGWDYNFLKILNSNQKADGAEIGIAVTDYFMNYYGIDSKEILTMSVINLSNVNEVMNSMGKLMEQCTYSLYNDTISAFTTLATKRSITKTFGNGSPRDNECDMVDIADMATKLQDLYPTESAQVLDALKKSVIYNKHNSNINLGGLSTYYIYSGIEPGNLILDAYSSLNMNHSYTNYLNHFYSILDNNTPFSNEPITSSLTLWEQIENTSTFKMIGLQLNNSSNNLWPKINGINICLYPINASKDYTLYATPIELNGNDCDIILFFSKENPQGIISGVRYEDGLIVQKGLDKINYGDKISFYYQTNNFNESYTEDKINWHKSNEITVNNELILEWEANNNDNTYYSYLLTDINNNQYYTDLQNHFK